MPQVPDAENKIDKSIYSRKLYDLLDNKHQEMMMNTLIDKENAFRFDIEREKTEQIRAFKLKRVS